MFLARSERFIMSKLRKTCYKLYYKCKELAPQEMDTLLDFYNNSRAGKQSDEWYEDWQDKLEDIIFKHTK
jgi:hypothetical protein